MVHARPYSLSTCSPSLSSAARGDHKGLAGQVVYIGTDPLYWVRREASFAVGALAKPVSTEAVLPFFLPLFEAPAHDTVWHVRHSAVFGILTRILTRQTPQHRRALALDTLLTLVSDVTPTVRSGVLGVLGEVMYTSMRVMWAGERCRRFASS